MQYGECIYYITYTYPVGTRVEGLQSGSLTVYIFKITFGKIHPLHTGYMIHNGCMRYLIYSAKTARSVSIFFLIPMSRLFSFVEISSSTAHTSKALKTPLI